MTETADASPSGRPRGAPGWAVWLLIVLATIIAMGATTNTWVSRQALDTDQWVKVTDDMLANDDVRAALSTYLVAELFRTVDVQAELASALPGPTAGLAGPLAATLRGNAVGLVNQLLESPAFRRLWTNVNTTAHTAFVRVVRDDTRDSISTANGAFVVDARSLLVGVADRLGLPSGVSDRIPQDAGQIVVFQSDQLNALQRAVKVIDVVSVYLLVVVVILYAVAVFISRDRRVTLRNVGWSITVASALLLVFQRLAKRVAVEQLATAASGRAAVNAIVSIATNLLNELAWAGLSLGVIIVLYAVLIGPSSPAVAVRRFSAPVMSHMVGAWLAALVFLAFYLVFVPGFSLQRWVPALIFVVLFVVAVESLRRLVVREHRAVDAPSAPAEPTLA